MEMLEQRELLSTYYLSASGNDDRSGRSRASAWKTIDRLNQQTLKPGDMILFEGKKTFYGSIYIPSREGGTLNNPVIFSNYGKGRPIIKSGNRPGVDIAQTAGVAITNLNFVGGGRSNNTAGIYVHTDRKNLKLKYLHIRNVVVQGYGREGIKVEMTGRGSSLSIAKVMNTTLRDNLWGGIKVVGSSQNSNKQWVVQRVSAYNNFGSRSTSNVTGSGIYLADVEDAVIQRCVVFNNGKDGSAPVGIWSAGSNRVTMQYNESYDNRTRTISDGGGFDFDWDVTNSVMQYNYSHGNDGPGFLLYAGSKKSNGNIIRYNISENDGRKNGKGGIQIGGNVTNADIYNNVVFMKPSGSSLNAAFIAHDWGSNGKVPQNISVRNNIFQTTGGVKMVSLTTGVANKSKNINFSANAYYSTGATFKIQWGSKTYNSLNDWRGSKGQEKYKGTATGFQGNPKLSKPGTGGTIGDADQLTTLQAYRLASNSPVINKGVPIATFLASLPPENADFYGEAGLRGGKFDMGADEVR
jgi:hypothetical protein